MEIRKETIPGLVKRVRQIAQEVDKDYVGEYDLMRLDSLAFRLKLIASDYHCYINSWVSVDAIGRSGAAECYNSLYYIEDEEDTWEIISSESEPIAIIAAFKWLADRGYFISENRLC